ncbi:MAG TPA: right-handed parallel beta-helix repeat-containing protein [Candidatus Nitrosocosmicus sp.]|nr:right-handed parallel beta-helix repeat-containing protein [Candidatus Nitrosocosmicus sp.]
MNKAECYVSKNTRIIKFSIILILFSVVIQLPLFEWNLASSSTGNNSILPQTNQLGPQKNIITSQNTGNSNSNDNSGDRIGNSQEQTSDLNLDDSQTQDESNNTEEDNTTPLVSANNGQDPPTRDQKALSTELNPACGQIIQGNVKLGSNLICDNDGLIVGGNDTIIDMNGFSLKGPGVDSNKVGIMIGGQNNVTITGNGIISGFQSGIYVSGGTNVYANEINVNNNKVAFYLTGAQNVQISNNMVSENTIGVALHSSKDAEVNFNQLSKNRLSGVTLINTANSTLHGNNILNTSNGIFLDTQSSLNKVDFNNVFNNILDVNNANNLPININNNYYSNNNCQTSLPSGLCIGR